MSSAECPKAYFSALHAAGHEDRYEGASIRRSAGEEPATRILICTLRPTLHALAAVRHLGTYPLYVCSSELASGHVRHPRLFEVCPGTCIRAQQGIVDQIAASWQAMTVESISNSIPKTIIGIESNPVQLALCALAYYGRQQHGSRQRHPHDSAMGSDERQNWH